MAVITRGSIILPLASERLVHQSCSLIQPDNKTVNKNKKVQEFENLEFENMGVENSEFKNSLFEISEFENSDFENFGIQNFSIRKFGI